VIHHKLAKLWQDAVSGGFCASVTTAFSAKRPGGPAVEFQRMNFLLVTMAVLGFAAQGPLPDFSGIWKQDNEQCSPKRTGDVTLRIEHRDPELIVETNSNGLIARHALQRYTTDGAESKSTGADGDEFHSTVEWRNGVLVFEILELEDGKRLKSTEIWSLTDGGRSLKRVRRTERNGEQTLVYVRSTR
jgi:hypothetical protein